MGALFIITPIFASKPSTASRCGISLKSAAKLIVVKNPLAELGNTKLESLADPENAISRYIKLLWWNRFLGPIEAINLIRDLRSTRDIPLPDRPYGKNMERTVDEALVELATGVTRFASSPYRSFQRRDPQRYFFRPSLKRAAYAGKWGGGILLTLWLVGAGYGYFSVRKDGFSEIPTLESRTQGFDLSYLLEYGDSPKAELRPKTYKNTIKGYRETERSMNHAIQMQRDTVEKFNIGIISEHLALESALNLRDPVLHRDAIEGLYKLWRDRPDVLLAPDWGDFLSRRMDHLLDQFDPERKIWNQIASEDLDESAK